MLGHPIDARDYKIASEMLEAVGIDTVCLLTNNPDKIKQLMKHGINVVERMPLVAGVGIDNMEYLVTKVEKMGHKISDDALNGN
jgi:3,4-dihydroxy 2-butanone 4-phosphate synthase/GTP cyclohydrolase II